MTLQPRPGILDIKPYKPGAAAPPGAAKLSSNENALGCSPKAAEAFQAAAGELHRYPDGGATRLREALADRYGIEAGRIVCGAGSDEIFQLLARAYLGPGDPVVQSQYGFLVYRLAAKQSGAEMIAAPERAYHADVDALIEAARASGAKIVFLANPNNPTGTYLKRDAIERLHDGLSGETLLVLDGAYAEFLEDPDYTDGIDLAREADNIIVTRTFSKIHGLAALRLGWAYGPQEVIEALHRVRGPFNVNLPAIETGLGALSDPAFEDRSRAHNARWAPWLAQAIGGAGFEVTPSVCNFVLVHFPDTPGRTAGDAHRFLAERGLIVRPLEPYGLPNALRISVGVEAENRAVAEAMAAFGEKTAAA